MEKEEIMKMSQEEFDELFRDMTTDQMKKLLDSLYSLKPNTNMPIKFKDKEYWVSRSIAISTFIFANDIEGNTHVLAIKRGKGTPDYQGMYCCPCGYVDWNENIYQAACREIKEETGVFLIPSDLEIIGINSSPLENRQNITVRLYAFLQHPTTFYQEKFSSKFSEKDEIDDIRWIRIHHELMDINGNDLFRYKWAFGHFEIIKHVYENIVNASLIKKIARWLYMKFNKSQYI